jgi:hypothetical protein
VAGPLSLVERLSSMGTTFVTLARESPGKEPGFWMRDRMLELWLRLLALHLPEPTDSGEHRSTLAIRNEWLLASCGYFVGCVPHGMEEACATPEGRKVVRVAIDSLLGALTRASAPLDAGTLDFVGKGGHSALIGRHSTVARQFSAWEGPSYESCLRGRPRGRKHDSRPRRVAVLRVHVSEPYGRPRDTECRKRRRSPAESGSLTRSSQRSSRTGILPTQSNGWPCRQPCRLDHFQSSARATNSARSGLRST